MRRGIGLAAAGLVTALTFAASAPAVAAPGPSDAPEYWFDTWHVQSLWDSGARGQGVVIAEIDTGVNAGIPELSGRILPGTDLGLGGNGQTDREVDEFGHGTAMASIMVARSGLLGITGLAPDAKILPIAVPLNGTTDAGQPDRLPEAIRYAADHGAKIISMSLGGKRVPGTDSLACDPDEQEAIYYALRKGALLVAAVGNTGTTSNTVEDPGVCLGVLAVGAVDSSGTVATFSGRQPYLSLVAPGVNVPSLSRVAGQAYSGDGTSQATALTSAAAALVWSRYPKLTARDVATRILTTLDGRRDTPSSAYGYGELDAYRAVTASVATAAGNPVFNAVAPFLARAAALSRAAPAAPKVAAHGSAPTGPVRIGSVRASTDPRLVSGAVLGGLGLLALVALLLAGRRRRRLAPPAPTPLPALYYPPPGPTPYGPAPYQPAPYPPPADAWAPPAERPRPRPYPHPPE